MNAIGISLPWDYLSRSYLTIDARVVKDTLGPPVAALKELKGLGVTSIELRHLHPELTAVDMLRVFSLLDDSGVNITIHSESLPVSKEWSVLDIFPWFGILEEADVIGQNEIVVAIHPLENAEVETVEDLRLGTIAILRKLVQLQNDWKHRYRFALENQRVKGSVNPGRSFDGILSMCDEIDSPAVGICWDFGHGVANHIKNSLPLYPPKEFLAACIHTHIHDLGPSGATHWPFAENAVPLEDFGGLLVAQAYKGVFNLELGFDRFAAVKGKWDLLAASISRLRQLGAN